MDMGLIFPNLHVGFEVGCRRRVVTGVNGYPLYGLAKAGSRVRFAAPKAMYPCFPEKHPIYRNAGRTKTDTGGRVQRYQGAREKPR